MAKATAKTKLRRRYRVARCIVAQQWAVRSDRCICHSERRTDALLIARALNTLEGGDRG